MPRVERTIDISASQDKIFKIVDDDADYARWNIVVNEVTVLGPGHNFFKSNVGDILIVDTEAVENEHVTWHMENSDLNSIGYIIEPKGDLSEVTIWTEFENKKLVKGYEKVADLVLKGLKNYVDFIEEGGDPEDFDKKQLMVSP